MSRGSPRPFASLEGNSREVLLLSRGRNRISATNTVGFGDNKNNNPYKTVRSFYEPVRRKVSTTSTAVNDAVYAGDDSGAFVSISHQIHFVNHAPHPHMEQVTERPVTPWGNEIMEDFDEETRQIEHLPGPTHQKRQSRKINGQNNGKYYWEQAKNDANAMYKGPKALLTRKMDKNDLLQTFSNPLRQSTMTKVVTPVLNNSKF